MAMLNNQRVNPQRSSSYPDGLLQATASPMATSMALGAKTRNEDGWKTKRARVASPGRGGGHGSHEGYGAYMMLISTEPGLQDGSGDDSCCCFLVGGWLAAPTRVVISAYGSKTVLIKRTILLMGRGGNVGVGWGGWGGVGVLTFCLVRTVHITTLPRSLECLPRYMLLRCRELWNACHVTCCYAAEISGMLATLHVATLQRSLECLPRYMLLRCRGLWNACHVTCCYAAEVSGMLATRYMLLRCRGPWNACHVTCCYAAEVSGKLATLHVATLPRYIYCIKSFFFFFFGP